MATMTEDPIVFEVDTSEAGQRLDRILAGRFPEVSRSQVQRAFAAEQVTVDGQPRPKSYKPLEGCTVSLTPFQVTSLDAQPEDIPLSIIYEDEHLLVVNKAPNMVVHPAPGHPGGTLVNALLHHNKALADTGDPLRPGIVHRLDKETSGLLVVARSAEAHRTLAAQLKDRTLGRIYLALSWGDWREPEGILRGNLGRHLRDRQRQAVLPRGGREAATRYKVIEELSFVQLCQVQLETGRTHQIRVHFAHHGHPVVGDPLYGDDRRGRNVRPVDRQAAARLVAAAPRQLLHAAELHLLHPADGKLMEFQAPLPDDFTHALDQLRKDLGRDSTPA